MPQIHQCENCKYLSFKEIYNNDSDNQGVAAMGFKEVRPEEGVDYCDYYNKLIEYDGSDCGIFSGVQYGNGQIEESDELPQCVGKWNWGALFLTWIWGLSHRVWISLLSLIPFVRLVMCFVLAIYGSEWAWEKEKDSTTPEEFDKSQHIWGICGVLLFVFTTLLYSLYKFSVI